MFPESLFRDRCNACDARTQHACTCYSLESMDCGVYNVISNEFLGGRIEMKMCFSLHGFTKCNERILCLFVFITQNLEIGEKVRT